jgi:hypothetical protein
MLQRQGEREKMADGQRHSGLPWRVVGALTLVAVVLAGLLGWLLVQRGHHTTAGLTAREQAAVDAAAREIVDAQTFRLAHFDADFARATAGLTGDMLQELTSKKAALRSSLQKSKHDTSATVTQAALDEVDGAKAVVLLSMKNYRIDKSGQRTPFATGSFKITMSEVGGKWLASDLTSVGLM